MIHIVATGRDVAMLTRSEGAIIIERMQFLTPQEARTKRRAAVRYQNRKHRAVSPPISRDGPASLLSCSPGTPLAHNDDPSGPPEAA